MDEIKLVISNPNNLIYKCIVLRKFFYMIFIDANGRKLYMYIASVFGGTTESVDQPEKAYISVRNDASTQCSLNFEFLSSNSIVEKFNVTNITDSFFDQKQYIEKVWGKCEPLESQADVNQSLKDCYPDLYPGEKVATVDVTKRKVFRITQGEEQSHKCIATQGNFQMLGDQVISSKYQLSCPTPVQGRCIDGLEAMNWIKIEIDLKSSILNKPVQFSIKLDKGTFFTPDFTWYFAPPAGHVISADSYVKIGDKQEKNAIQSVSDETTVYFSEWTSPPESIDERKKSRILFKSAGITDIAKLSTNEILAVSLHLDNPQGPTNRQFFFGLLIAFLLAFCSDKTRINDYYSCLKTGCTCAGSSCICQNICNAITIIAPILLLCCFLTYIITPKKAFPSFQTRLQSIFKACRIVGLVVTSILLVYVYGIWLVFPDLMRSIISCKSNQWILTAGAVIAAVTNATYLTYCLVYLKRKIYNYL